MASFNLPVFQHQHQLCGQAPGRRNRLLHSLPGNYSAVGKCKRVLRWPQGASASPTASTLQLRDQVAYIGRRRTLILQLLTIGSLALPAQAEEASSQDPPAGNAVLRSLGIGDPDIFYPRFFEGTWDCYSTLLSVETPQGEDKADIRSVNVTRKQIGYTVVYKARFVPYESYIIGDRLFTTKSLVESTIGQNVITSFNWSPDQPNRLTLVLNGGIMVENLVTKRSAGMSAPGQFDTSEYSKQVFDYRKEGVPPSVKASRNLTRYRWDSALQNVTTIEALQRVAMYPVPGNELGIKDIFNRSSPVAVYKYIVKFTRSS